MFAIKTDWRFDVDQYFRSFYVLKHFLSFIKYYVIHSHANLFLHFSPSVLFYPFKISWPCFFFNVLQFVIIVIQIFSTTEPLFRGFDWQLKLCSLRISLKISAYVNKYNYFALFFNVLYLFAQKSIKVEKFLILLHFSFLCLSI